MRLLFSLSVLLFSFARLASGKEFTVLVYNVENLFDLDGVSLFDQYQQPPEGDYGAPQLLNKLASVHATLSAVNEGAGPEVILFQELELDRTPFRTPEAGPFLRAHEERTLEELLEEERWARSLPAELLLLKYLHDRGMRGYHIAQPDPSLMETHPPHKNVVFSRFPITFVRQRPSLDARDLLVVGLDVEGHSLIVLNNHWKSGASNPDLEPVRVQNARVVRAELESILVNDPLADVIIAGDFNAYYNHSAAFPEIGETAVNDVLRANGREVLMTKEGSGNLYNLWFELPPEERGSEVWRGAWGTLMQMVISQGLYDNRGIQYVDNSFDRLVLPGLNVDSRWGRPLSWSNHGDGSGFSDHLAILARFQVAGPGAREPWMKVLNPTDEPVTPERPRVPYERMDRRAVPPVEVLAELSPNERVARMGELFLLDTIVESVDPLRLTIGELSYEVFAPMRSVRETLETLSPGDPLKSFVDLGDWRGNLQLVIRHPSWLQEPRLP